MSIRTGQYIIEASPIEGSKQLNKMTIMPSAEYVPLSSQDMAGIVRFFYCETPGNFRNHWRIKQVNISWILNAPIECQKEK